LAGDARGRTPILLAPATILAPGDELYGGGGGDGDRRGARSLATAAPRRFDAAYTVGRGDERAQRDGAREAVEHGVVHASARRYAGLGRAIEGAAAHDEAVRRRIPRPAAYAVGYVAAGAALDGIPFVGVAFRGAKRLAPLADRARARVDAHGRTIEERRDRWDRRCRPPAPPLRPPPEEPRGAECDTADGENPHDDEWAAYQALVRGPVAAVQGVARLRDGIRAAVADALGGAAP
jgi:hypothetical protein